MHVQLLDLLCCPACAGALQLEGAACESPVHEGTLRCAQCGRTYPIRNGIPRFVATEEYADSFGWQWNRFRTTQVDRYNGTTISRDRFFTLTGWTPADLAGATVLDVGCGSGRFVDVALRAGARVVAVDLSSAVDACVANFPHDCKLDVVQASIYELPFRKEVFDRVYCIGVLQHTPDVPGAVHALAQPLQRDGQLAVWVYEDRFRHRIMPRYWLRPVTKRLPKERLFRYLEAATPWLLRVSGAVAKVPFIGRQLRRFVPVADYAGILPLTPAMRAEWALLDTFDWLSPAYDQPQSFDRMSQLLRSAGLAEIRRTPGRGIGLPIVAWRANGAA